MPPSASAPPPAPEKSARANLQLLNLVSEIEKCFDALLGDDSGQIALTRGALEYLVRGCASDLRDAIERGKGQELLGTWREYAPAFRARLTRDQQPLTVDLGGRQESVYLISEDHLRMVFENCPKPYSEPGSQAS